MIEGRQQFQFINLLFQRSLILIMDFPGPPKKQSIHQPHNSQSHDDSEEDDLAVFARQKLIQIYKDNQLNPNIYEDQKKEKDHNPNDSESDFKRFYGHHEGQKRQQSKPQKEKPQPDTQTIVAKKLRSYHALKYFERLKLAFMRKIFNRTRQLHQVTSQNHQSYAIFYDQFCTFLSIVPQDLIKLSYKIRDKNPFTHSEIQILAVFKKVFSSKNLASYFQSVNPDQKPMTKAQLMFKFSEFLNCQLRKVEFFSLSSFVDEAFYNLDFEKDNTYRKKKSKKTSTKFEEQVKNRINKKVLQQQLSSSENFVDLNNFSFDTVEKSMSISQDQINKELKDVKMKSQRIQEIKRSFSDELYQIFSHRQQKWVMFVAIQGHFEELDIEWFKAEILHGRPIVGFIGVEFLKPKEKYVKLLDFRKADNIMLRDLSMYFCDQWKKLAQRKKRVGIKPLMGKILRFYDYIKPYDILEDFQAFQFAQSQKQMKKILIEKQIPKTKDQFNLSDYFLTKSRVGKYHVLSPEAKPISNELQFNEEKIYWKDDLVPVCSRMGWIDFNRMVSEGAEPLKKTENKNKKAIELYRYEQTQPYVLPMDREGNFILDSQHNSIYVPPELQLPEGTCIVREKVTYICNKHKIRFAKLVQGFIHSVGMRVLPNEIGYLIYAEDRDFVLQKYQERMQLLNKNKQTRYDEKLQKMWKEAIKYVRLMVRMGGELKDR